MLWVVSGFAHWPDNLIPPVSLLWVQGGVLRQAGITKVQNNSAFVCYRDFVCAFIPLTLQISRTHFFTWSAKRHILIVCTSRRGIYKNQTCSIGDAHSHRIRCSDVSITISILRESSAAASPDHRLKNHAPSPPFGVLTVRRSERPPPFPENGIVHLDDLFPFGFVLSRRRPHADGSGV